MQAHPHTAGEAHPTPQEQELPPYDPAAVHLLRELVREVEGLKHQLAVRSAQTSVQQEESRLAMLVRKPYLGFRYKNSLFPYMNVAWLFCCLVHLILCTLTYAITLNSNG